MESQQLKEMLGHRAKDIIIQGLNVQPNKNGAFLCVLHNEKTPSMSWFEDGHCFKCLGCGENVDIYRYYMEWENCSFYEAI